MLFSRLFAFVALIAFVSSAAVAQETATKTTGEKCAQCPVSGQCPHAAATLTSSQQEEASCQECPIMTAAMEKFPKMTYKVGEESTCCSQSASALAKKSSLPVHYVVGKKSFEDQSVAYTALVEHSEKFVNDFVTPHSCETSGTTSVAGHSCACPVSSAKYAEKVKAAVDAVKISYKVGEESCGCPNQAAALAKSSGESTQFVVGKEVTTCNMTARINLARAKYRAAVAAINAATTPLETDGS